MDMTKYIFLLLVSATASATKQNDDMIQTVHSKVLSLSETVATLSYTVQHQSKMIAELQSKSDGQRRSIETLMDKSGQQERFIKTLLDGKRKDGIRLQYLEEILYRHSDEIPKQENVEFTNSSMDYKLLSRDKVLSIQKYSNMQSDSFHSDPKPPRQRHFSKKSNVERNTQFRKTRLLLPTTARPSPDGTVAFYAFMSKTVPNPGSLQNLVFDTVVTNAGNGYHNHTGVFIPPTSGYYAFSWSIYQYQDSYHSLQLVCNGKVLGSMYVRTENYDARLSSKTVVAHVSAGDDVYVRKNDDSAPCGNKGTIRSDICSQPSFSGWLIH